MGNKWWKIAVIYWFVINILFSSAKNDNTPYSASTASKFLTQETNRDVVCLIGSSLPTIHITIIRMLWFLFKLASPPDPAINSATKQIETDYSLLLLTTPSSQTLSMNTLCLFVCMSSAGLCPPASLCSVLKDTSAPKMHHEGSKERRLQEEL